MSGFDEARSNFLSGIIPDTSSQGRISRVENLCLAVIVILNQKAKPVTVSIGGLDPIMVSAGEYAPVFVSNFPSSPSGEPRQLTVAVQDSHDPGSVVGAAIVTGKEPGCHPLLLKDVRVIGRGSRGIKLALHRYPGTLTPVAYQLTVT